MSAVLPWIDRNVSRLEEAFDNMFGQHLARSLVTKSVRAHMRRAEPSKALVLSFHGWTGAGKNYVSRFIAESMYKNGMKSKYVHLFMSPLHFPHESEADLYKRNI
jgi:DNA-binding NtrC family response regulator